MSRLEICFFDEGQRSTRFLLILGKRWCRIAGKSVPLHRQKDNKRITTLVEFKV
jgi:hypothetical protein